MENQCRANNVRMLSFCVMVCHLMKREQKQNTTEFAGTDSFSAYR